MGGYNFGDLFKAGVVVGILACCAALGLAFGVGKVAADHVSIGWH
jgi:hypothetical protein